MRNKAFVLTKVGELEDKLRALEGVYSRAGSREEKILIFDRLKENIEEIRTLINTEPEFEV